MQRKNLAAYFAELFGTMLLVLFVGSVVTLYISTGSEPGFGTDFAVIGLVHAFLLFGLLMMFGAVSGGHFNPAVTLAVASLRRIHPLDATIYVVVQMIGGVLGALLCKALLLDDGRGVNYGAAQVSGLISGNVAGALVEGFGTFCLVLVILATVFSKKSVKDWAPLAIGTTLGFVVMVAGPLTGAAVNPARWFGPALVSGEWGGVWPFLVGPVAGALVAVAIFRWVLEVASPAPAEPPERVRGAHA